MKVQISEEMKIRAKQEAIKRNPHINHHFDVNHLTGEERDIIGFLGEFACCELLKINWKDNIRKDYLTIDNFDVTVNGKRADVKTETLPEKFLKAVLSKTINDDGVFGRRLINQGQVILLPKYDIVIFGAFERGNYNYWFPFGYLESKYILENYKITNQRPDGGKYPFAALPIKSSDLKPINELL